MLLISGNAKNVLDVIGTNGNRSEYGWLLTPRRTLTQTGLHGLKYGIDNEVYALGNEFNARHYWRTLKRIGEAHGTDDCLFATAVDVVGNARNTLCKAKGWLPAIRSLGLPAALVGQDGLEDEIIPWDDFDCLFIGGTTEWKLSRITAELIREAKERGKWTHMGRVNSTHRASRLIELCDSADGSAYAKYPAKYVLKWRNWHRAGLPQQLHLLPCI